MFKVYSSPDSPYVAYNFFNFINTMDNFAYLTRQLDIYANKNINFDFNAYITIKYRQPIRLRLQKLLSTKQHNRETKNHNKEN